MIFQKTPQVRFREFSDNWSEEKISDIGDLFAGGDIDKDCLVKNGLYPVIANSLSNNGYLGFYNSFKFTAPAVTITGRGDVGVARARFVNFTPVVRLLVLKPINESDIVFLENAINRKNIFIESTGVPQLTIPQLGSVLIYQPTFNEQSRLGKFFQNLDQSIALHEKKLAQTQNFKKAMLEKMFPKQGSQRPEIRLKGFSDDWEERQLKDISFKVIEKNSERLYTETFTNSAQFGVISQRDFFDKDISNTSNIGGYYVVKDNDFIYNPRISNFAPVGPVKRNKLGRTGVVSPLYFVFRTHDVDHKFLEVYFETSVWHKFMFLNGDTGARSDRLAIKDTIFMEMPIYSPSFEEQQKVGQFFKQLDDAINLQKQQLQTVKNLKQAFLEKMFV